MKPLRENEEALLKGRGLALETISQYCSEKLPTVVASAPGLGVTSLLQAGVTPMLKRAGFIVILFSDWQGKYFVTNLRESIAQAVREQADPSWAVVGEPMDRMMGDILLRTGKPVAVLMDQFEDYLRCHNRTDLSEAFDAELARAINSREGVFIFGIQDHAVGAFERLCSDIPNLRRNQITLDALNPDDAREAVFAELSARGLEIEPAAVDAIVSAGIAAKPANRVHPFYLKMATARLIAAARALRSSDIPLSLIADRGGADRLILESLDPAINEFERNHVELLFRWCNILMSPKNERFAVTEKALMEYGGRLNRFALTFLPRALEARILRSVESPDAIRYEIARDSLTPILRDWWERHEATLVSRRRARFRVMSLSLALGAIVIAYVVWLLLGK